MAQYRQNPLVNDQIYHIYNRSIAKYAIFNSNQDFDRMHQPLNLYRHKSFTYKYSAFLNLTSGNQINIIQNLPNNDLIVEIIAYCIMPTHLHLIIKQNVDGGIVKFMARILNSYSRYFNTKHQRTGPLWSGRFKNVLIENDEQLLHMSRYIHLNPTSAN